MRIYTSSKPDVAHVDVGRPVALCAGCVARRTASPVESELLYAERWITDHECVDCHATAATGVAISSWQRYEPEATER